MVVETVLVIFVQVEDPLYITVLLLVGGQGEAHPEFASSVNPITTRGADYAHLITASPPGFETQRHL